jgi:hypothetical protein
MKEEKKKRKGKVGRSPNNVKQQNPIFLFNYNTLFYILQSVNRLRNK